MKNLKYILLLTLMFSVGSFVGHLASRLLFSSLSIVPCHLCTCDNCKTVRQLEAVEVMDSVIRDRIIIEVNKGED